ncbi:MAG: RNA polymerase sigma factor [Myxococcota bacterium]
MEAAVDLRTRSRAGPTDATLVEAAQAGESWAQEVLFRRYLKMANGLAVRLLGDREEARDLVQDAFYKALTELGSLQQPSAFSSWLGTIVVRAAYKRLRRRKLLQRLGLRPRDAVDLDEEVFTANAPPEAVEQLRQVYRSLGRLDATTRVAFILHVIEGQTIRETADSLGVSITTVKRRVAVAKQALERLRAEGA